MRVQCSISMTASDIRCPVCGQGVLIHNAARSRDLPQLQRKSVAEDLREQHASGGHVAMEFSVDVTHAISVSEAAAPAMQDAEHLVLAAFAS